MNESNNLQKQNGLRKSLVELSEQFPDTAESRTTKKKLSFFRVLKNNLKCAFCKEKDCLARYYPDRKGMSLRYSGQYYPIGCQRKHRK